MAVITAKELCTDAMRLAGYLPAKATASSEDLDMAFIELQGLIDIWQTEQLMDLYTEDLSCDVIGGASSITLGSGISFDINVPYIPTHIDNLRVVRSGATDIIIPQRQWIEMAQSSINEDTTLTYPGFFTYKEEQGIGVINLWPKTSAGFTAKVTIAHKMGIPTTENEVMSLPTGWYQALRYCLADNLQIPLNIPQGEMSSKLTATASSYKARIKSSHQRVAPTAKMDSSLLRGRFSSSRRAGGYNINKG